jgi:hypothetical protein
MSYFFSRPKSPYLDRLTPAGYALRRQKAREARERAAGGEVPTLEEIVNANNLLRTFDDLKRRGGQAPGADGLRYTDLSRREAARLLSAISATILDGTYRPWPSRQLAIPKASGSGIRRLSLPSIMDRVVESALQRALQPFWEQVFLDNSYGFRPRKSIWQLLARLERLAIQEQRVVLVTDDIRDAFPSVVINDAMVDHAQHIPDSKLCQFINVMLRSGDHRSVGIGQGSPYSPIALNVCLHHVHDIPIARVFPAWLRYADNLAYCCQTVSEGLQVLNEARALLADAGFALKGKDGPPVDLRISKAQLLGLTLRFGDDGLKLGIGESAWDDLRLTLLEGHRADDPTSYARRAIDGWITAYGPALVSRMDDVPPRISQIATGLGFGELSRKEIQSQIERSARPWESLRETQPKADLPAVGPGPVMVTTPSVTDAPLA